MRESKGGQKRRSTHQFRIDTLAIRQDPEQGVNAFKLSPQNIQRMVRETSADDRRRGQSLSTTPAGFLGSTLGEGEVVENRCENVVARKSGMTCSHLLYRQL